MSAPLLGTAASSVRGASITQVCQDWGDGLVAGGALDRIPNAGHFVKEDASDDLAEVNLRRADEAS
jgi:hypothetical protein